MIFVFLVDKNLPEVNALSELHSIRRLEPYSCTTGRSSALQADTMWPDHPRMLSPSTKDFSHPVSYGPLRGNLSSDCSTNCNFFDCSYPVGEFLFISKRPSPLGRPLASIQSTCARHPLMVHICRIVEGRTVLMTCRSRA